MSRKRNRTEDGAEDAKNVVVKDIFDLTTDDLKGFDAVVDAFGAWQPELLPQHSATLAQGDSIVMPANHPHAVYGVEPFKMLLVVAFPEAAAQA